MWCRSSAPKPCGSGSIPTSSRSQAKWLPVRVKKTRQNMKLALAQNQVGAGAGGLHDAGIADEEIAGLVARCRTPDRVAALDDKDLASGAREDRAGRQTSKAGADHHYVIA